VTMNSAVNATAFFAATYQLTVSKSGTGVGTVTSDTDGISCGLDCTENYLGGSIVTLTADPNDGSALTGWSGGGCSGTGTCEVTMDSAKSVTANFTVTYTLTVAVFEPACCYGTITSADTEINCPGDCTETYPEGTPVMLTANPIGGSFFATWAGGGCTGTGSCSVIMNQDRTVTATFLPT
jgi:Divergent InlB B-repeat domain